MFKGVSAEVGAPAGEIKVLVVDIDGTIAGDSNTVSNSVKRALKAVLAKGIKLTIATGRMYQSSLRFYQEIGGNLPLLCYQGALVKDPATETVHRHSTIKREIAAELLDYFLTSELNSEFSIHCYIDDQLYVKEVLPTTKSYVSRSQIKPIPVGDLRQLMTKDLTKMLALCNRPEITDKILADLQQRYQPDDLYLTKSVPTFLEATNPLANKGYSLRYLTEELLGLRAENIMAIGDNFNDIEMINYAGLGVAMGDAPAPVKAAAKWVAPSVESDGVVAAIEKFIL